MHLSIGEAAKADRFHVYGETGDMLQRRKMRIAEPPALGIGTGNAESQRHRDLGKPSTRSAVISRWISLVPPEIENTQLQR